MDASLISANTDTAIQNMLKQKSKPTPRITARIAGMILRDCQQPTGIIPSIAMMKALEDLWEESNPLDKR